MVNNQDNINSHEYFDNLTLQKDLSISLLNEIDAFVFIFDAELMKPIWINKYFEKKFHFSKEELQDTSSEEFLELFHPKSLQLFINRIRYYEDDTQKSGKTVYQIKSKYGEWIYMLTSSRVYERKPNGAIKYLMGYATEVSEKELDDQLKQMQQLSSKAGKNKLLDSLTRRELDVLTLISKCMTDKEICEKLNISIHTAKTHRKRILSKLGLKNTASLVRFAVENGIG